MARKRGSKSGTSSDAKRAYRLRLKVKAGTATDADRSWLEGYVPRKNGRKTNAEREAAAAELEHDPAQVELPLMGEVVEDPEVAPEFGAATHDTPAPETPRVTPRGGPRPAGGAGGWREKYRPGAADGEREATCLQAAGWWLDCLMKMNAGIVAMGATPAFDDATLLAMKPCFVLTVDKLLPDDLVVGPEIQVAVASTVVTSQAWWLHRRATAGAAQKRATRHATPDPTPPPSSPPVAEEVERDPRRLSIVRAPAKKFDDSVVI